jgi:hypothetical protein
MVHRGCCASDGIAAAKGWLRARAKITSHFYAPMHLCLAALPNRRNISIFLRFGALPDRRLNT